MTTKNLISSHFPRIRILNGEKFLWNPVTKQVLKNLPEERVRLQTIEFLNRRCGIPHSRMSTEKGLRTASSENTVRTDILVYDRNAKPQILVECKSPDIKITEKTAIQISQYNTTIKAPLLLLTNGKTSFLFEMNEDGLVQKSLESLIVNEEPTRDDIYWQERGFLGMKLKSSTPSKLVQLLFDEKESGIYFMEMPDVNPHPALSHYYRVYNTGPNSSWAVSLVSGVNQHTFLVGLEFEKGHGKTIVSVDIDERIVYYTAMIRPEEPKTLPIADALISDLNGGDMATINMWFDRLKTEIQRGTIYGKEQ